MDVFQYVARRTQKSSPSPSVPSQSSLSSVLRPAAQSVNWSQATKKLDIEELIHSLGTKLGKKQDRRSAEDYQRARDVDLVGIERKVEHYSKMQKFIRELAEKQRTEEIRKMPSLHPSLSLPHLTPVNFGDSRIEYIFHSVRNDIPSRLPRSSHLRRQSIRTSHRVTTEIVEEDEDETSTRFFQVRESPSPYSVAESMSEFDDAVKMLLGKSFADPQSLYSGKKCRSPIPEEDSHFVSSDEEVAEELECLAPRRRLERNRHFHISKAEDDWPTASIEPLGLRLYRPFCPPTSKEVPAGDPSPLYGPLMKYGFLRKKRGEHNKFHKRFVVLRGFRLYWYRKSNATWAKGVLTMPLEPVIKLKVTHESCFGVSKGNKKNFVVVEDTASVTWDLILSNQIAYRRLIEDPGMFHDFHDVVSYFQNMHSSELKIRDRPLPSAVLSCMSLALPAHSMLQIISLVNCQLTDDSIQPFLTSIPGTIRLESLDLSLNSLTSASAARVSDIIKQEESQWNRLIHITLSGNPIKDEGLDVLSRALRVRFRELYWPKALYQLPLFTLEVSACGVGDAGISALCEMLNSTFEAIAAEDDIEPRMKLDLSHNHCSSSSFEKLTDLMAVYQPISSLNLAFIGEVSATDVSNFLEVMVQNYSVLTLDMSGLPLSIAGLSTLVDLLNYNYVLTSVKVTLGEEVVKVAGAHYKEVKSLFTIRTEDQ